MDNNPKKDATLDSLFASAKAHPPVPEPDFMARLARDADSALPQALAPKPTPASSLLTNLSGLFAASGLTGAAALGIWIGFVMPETLNTMIDGFASDKTVSLSALLPGADLAALSE